MNRPYRIRTGRKNKNSGEKNPAQGRLASVSVNAQDKLLWISLSYLHTGKQVHASSKDTEITPFVTHCLFIYFKWCLYLLHFPEEIYLLRYQVPNKSILILSFPDILYIISFVISSESPLLILLATLYLKHFKDCMFISWSQQQLHDYSHLKNVDYPGNIFCWCNSGILVLIVTRYLHFLQSCLSRLRYCWCRYCSLSRNGKNKSFFPPSRQTVNQISMMLKQWYCTLQLNFCPTVGLQLQNSRTMFIRIFVPALSPLVFADSMNKSILVRFVG